ncbi:MAG: sugar phosphate isomerase/epimerase family protein [Hyphomicrobiaceae bacterium]
MPQRLISLAALTVLDAGPAGQIRAAAEAGFGAVGLRLMPLLASDTRVVGIAANEAEIEHLLEQTGLEVLEIGVFPLKAQMDWPAIEAVIDFSGRIDARFLVCPVEDTDLERATATYVRMCDLAAADGLKALIEFNPYSACRSLTEAVGLVSGAIHPASGLVIDALHLSRSGGDPGDLARVPADMLDLVHLCDAPAPPPIGTLTADELRAESRTARLLPGEGELWLDRLIEALPPDCPISIEAPSALHAHLPAAERARRALAATEALLDRIARSGV